ncbi:MAG: APC family permease [Polyangiales bacterium]
MAICRLGQSFRITDLANAEGPIDHLDQLHKNSLGTWRATAICGNDITSSCLYVSALCAAHAGVLAPLVLVIVAAVLYLFRKVYAEVGSALPLNGGCYTVLLNTTNKRVAAGAACLTLLSYVATAVISGGEAMHYAKHMFESLPIIPATIGLLGFFTVLSLIGITESAVVALVIFVFHMITLTILSGTAIYALVENPTTLLSNWRLPTTEGFGHALFFGFAAAMLGISGFESSANFIEEQKPGVFPKTLRNMWIAVALFNPLISFLSLGLLPLSEIEKVPPDLLAQMGTLSAGQWLGTLVSIDAVLVLSGAVLTSFVGVTGLMRRMALDRCLPQFLLRANKLRGTNHWIVISFFLICTTILFITNGQIETLAGVYTLSFLSVMALFAIGNMLLKTRRARLPRETRASWPAVFVALIAVIVGLIGNVLMNPLNVQIFGAYFLAVASVVTLMFLRRDILRVCLVVAGSIANSIASLNTKIRTNVSGALEEINNTVMVYFTKGDDPSILNRAVLYVVQNEQTSRFTVIYVYENDSDIPKDLREHISSLDHLYPELRIDFIAVKGAFGPELIDALSKRLNVPKNQMFIGTPGDHFPHRVEDLGGVRLIL